MKAALESHGGIKGCRVAVAEVDTTRKKKNKQTKIIRYQASVITEQLSLREEWHPHVESF